MEIQQKANLLKRMTEREGLPSLSPLVIHLVELAADDRSSARDLAAVIEEVCFLLNFHGLKST